MININQFMQNYSIFVFANHFSLNHVFQCHFAKGNNETKCLLHRKCMDRIFKKTDNGTPVNHKIHPNQNYNAPTNMQTLSKSSYGKLKDYSPGNTN